MFLRMCGRPVRRAPFCLMLTLVHGLVDKRGTS